MYDRTTRLHHIRITPAQGRCDTNVMQTAAQGWCWNAHMCIYIYIYIYAYIYIYNRIGMRNGMRNAMLCDLPAAFLCIVTGPVYLPCDSFVCVM